MIIELEQFLGWVDADGKPTQRATEFMNEMTRQVNLSTVLSGTGTPEGNVTAKPTQLYMDDAGTAGNILYIKKTGTAKTGWILV